MRASISSNSWLRVLSAAAALVPWGGVDGQLFENLQALSNRIKVGQPRVVEENGERLYRDEHPKGLAVADFDSDGKVDFVVSRLDGSLVVGWGKGDGRFESPETVPTPALSFRQVVTGDLNGDAEPDVAAADPISGKVILLFNNGGRTWAAPQLLGAWEGARNLVVLDWDGDGKNDLIIGGCDKDVSRNFDEPWLPPVPPIPPQGSHGIVFYKGDGAGNFLEQTNFAQLATRAEPPDDEDDSFPRPVYVLERWRPPGQNKDWILATHALEETVWILRHDVVSGFWPRDSIGIGLEGIRAMAVGPVSSPASSGVDDVVVASRELGTVIVFRLNYNEISAPIAEKRQQLDVPGGPRSLEIADLDADGWNELVVASRNTDRVIVFKNVNGELRRESEALTGRSPRELAAAELDGDGRTDFIVLNRDSSDLSILPAAGGPQVPRTGFSALDQTYLVDGDVAQLGLHDLNGDERDDVLQLHRSSAEVSVRLAEADGKLGSPAVYKMGAAPSAFSLADINNDSKLDLVTANLGDAIGGMMVVRMGDGLGNFGAPQQFRPPAEPPPAIGLDPNLDVDLPPGVVGATEFGRLYAVLAVDLDGDGNLDLAAGYYDCRIVFFKGDGHGNFSPTPGFSDHELYFVTGYEARIIVAADFDQDGDQDLALAAWPGDVIVLENTGNFFRQQSATDPPYERHFFPRYNNTMARARDISIVDVNEDNDPDLIIGTGMGTQILLGKPGINFERKMYPPAPGDPDPQNLPVVPTINFPVAAMVTADLDDDGANDDVAAICASDGCLNILTASEDFDGQFLPALVVEAPETAFLAAGDLDGDDKTDLVGSGGILWVALSNRRTSAAPPALSQTRPRLAHVVINEIQPQNSTVPVPFPGNPLVNAGDQEYVEIFNGSSEPAALSGWRLEVVRGDQTDVFAFPAATVLAPDGHQVVLFTRNTNLRPWATGFRLPAEGGTLVLRDSQGAVVDEVTYPTMDDNHSFARYADADPTWRVNHLPDPGRSNVDNGAIEPNAQLDGISLTTFGPGQTLRFFATALDDVGLVGMTIHWRLRGNPGSNFQRALLFDDGMSGDGGRLDGIFSGVIEPGLAAGTEIEFYLESEDLSGQRKFVPGQPQQTSDEGVAAELYTLRIPVAGPPSAIEISEVLPSNQRTVADDSGQFEDYVEVRNVGSAPATLRGLELAENLFGGSRRLKFNQTLLDAYPGSDVSLAPGQHRLLFCDAEDLVSPTVFHAPYRLDAEAPGQIYLVGRTAQGTQEILNYAHYPVLGPDLASARIGVGGRFFVLPPTPGLRNVPDRSLIPLIELREDGLHFLLGMATRAGQPVGLHRNDTLLENQWTPAEPGLLGDGFEHLFEAPIIERHHFYRLQE